MKPTIETEHEESKYPPRGTVPFDERPTCTIAEACYAMGLGKTKFYELMGDGAIETTRVGRRRLVRVPSLLAFLNRDATLVR